MYRHYFFVLFFPLNIICSMRVYGDFRHYQYGDFRYYQYESQCNSVKERSSMLQLREYLLCQYDSDVRPVKSNKNVTNMTMFIAPRILEYSQYSQIFTAHTWLLMSWTDMHLKWTPAEYDNIIEMKASVFDIWVPDIIIHNEYGDEETSLDQKMCSVQSDGEVLWTFQKKYSTYCVGDITWWPYDVLNCTIQLGSWSHSDDEIQIIELRVMDFTHNSLLEWELLKINSTQRVEKHKYNSDFNTTIISCHVIMRRTWGIIYIAYVIPSIVLMVLTLIALWLEPRSIERMIIANLNFICHLLCIQDVHWEMPKSGYSTPKLLVFYESSFAIASFTLILTSILRYLQELSSEPPGWISAVTMSILHSKVGRIFLVSVLDPVTTAKIEIDADDNTDLVQINNKESSWIYVTALIGWLALIIVSLAYIILLSTSFPVYIPINV